jgi:hypothetical protein
MHSYDGNREENIQFSETRDSDKCWVLLVVVIMVLGGIKILF